MTDVDEHFWAQQVAELTEMLTAATDTAVQRGKTLDDLRGWWETGDMRSIGLWAIDGG